MPVKTLYIDAANFSTLNGFYDEADRVLTRGLTWKTGHNLDAFNDLLRGGFGVHDYEEPIHLIWLNAKKSKRNLSKVSGKQTLYEIIVEIIISHPHITFTEQ